MEWAGNGRLFVKWVQPGTVGDPVVAYVTGAAPDIANAQTQMRVLDTGRFRWPVSVNDGDELPGNCYVVSPRTAYSRYADAEMVRLIQPLWSWPMRLLVRGADAWFRHARLDRLVVANNWLLSTNVYPDDWDGRDLPEITRFLQTEYPDHAVAFRSLNRIANPALMERMGAQGYFAVPSRQVYLYDGRKGCESEFLRCHNTRLDARLLQRTEYQVVEGTSLDDASFQRIVELYRQLYLDKYSKLNPQFGVRWMAVGARTGWLTLRALRHPAGRIDGVIGWFGGGEWLTAPVVGYDTSLPRSLGLYRLITRLCLQEVVERRCQLNFSAGAAHFKRLRGGKPVIEYTMVNVSHLPPARQRVWHVLRSVLDRVAVPLMRRWGL